MKVVWESFKEVRTIGGILLGTLAALTYFSGQYDNISLLEYWTLLILCSACSIYIVTKHRQETTKPFLIAIFLAGLAFLFAIVYRQNLRYNNYEVSWDIAYLNTKTDVGNRGLRVGLCVVNPNNFHVFVRVPSISANIDKNSGSFAEPDKEQTFDIGPESGNSIIFSDAMALGDADSGPHKGILLADVEYGRDQAHLNKTLPVRANPEYLQDDAGDVVGISLDPKTTTIPGSYDLVLGIRESKCRRIHS